MNGSRSYTSRQGGQGTSIDALNRTIEGLEARIEGLLGGRGGRHADEAASAARGNPLDDIRARQRQLEGHRSRDRLSQDPAGVRQPARAFDSARAGGHSLSEALAEMRRELRADIRDSLASELGTLRQDMRDLNTETRNSDMPDELRADLGRISAVIDRLGSQDGGAEALRRELESMRLMIDDLAREDSVRSLDDRWRSVEDQVSGLDIGGIRQELVNLAYRVDDIREVLAALPATRPVRELEDKIALLSDNIAAMADKPSALAADMSGRFEDISDRLDEITRAIAAVQPGQIASYDPAPMERLEARLASVAKKIDAMEPASVSPDIGSRIEALSARVSELADEEAVGRLDARLERLQDMLETVQNNQGEAFLPELNGHLADLAGKIDRIETGDIGETLAIRLDDLARRIDSIQMPAQQAASIPDAVIGRIESLIGRAEETASRALDPMPGFKSLEARLADIASRLDTVSQVPAAGSDEAMRSLETQIANLSKLIAGSQQVADSGSLGNRLASIEEHLTTNDEYILEAARQAAESALAAYSGNAGGKPSAQSIANMEVISALADDLKVLEELSRKSEDRTSRAFEAVQETLLKIAGRLEKLDIAPAQGASLAAAREDGGADGRDSQRENIRAQSTQVPARTPAQAAAIAAEFATETDVDDADTTGPEVRHAERSDRNGKSGHSLLSGLAAKIKPSRKKLDSGKTSEPRFTEQQVPPLDPAQELDRATANMPLEPGSGAPDINRILQKVREAQAAERTRETGGEQNGDKGEFLASARRAAMAAAAEIEAISGADGQKKPAGFLDMLKARRKPILMAVGAVLLALMTIPMVTGLLSDGAVDETAAVAPSIVEPAETEPTPVETLVSGPAVAEPSAVGNEPVSLAAASSPALPEVRVIEPGIATGMNVGMEAQNASTATGPVEAGPSPVAAPAETPAASSLEVELGALPDAFLSPALRAAAIDLDPVAFYEIGARFTEGRGVSVDLEHAASWYRRSADLGHAPSQYRIANFYEKGSGIERDVAAAKKWYQLAAEQGNVSAMHNLAVLYATSGAAPDYESAAAWFAKAAEVGVRDSQVNLAILYARGDGVRRDLEQSYKWFAIAANDGDKDAAVKRDEVFNALRPEQAENARALVANWKAQPLNAATNAVEVPAEWGGVETRTASIDMTKAVRNIQAILNKNGFDAGTADGVMGAKTIGAIKAFQTANGMAATGEVTDELIRKLLDKNQ